jgi:site-specific recombinase XerC
MEEYPMDDLTYTLRQLCRHNRDGSLATQVNRLRSLTLAARQLREAGFRQMRDTSLRGRHVDALLQRWQAEGLSAGTLKNRLSHLRWWAEKVSKARASCQGIIPRWTFTNAAMWPTETRRRNWATG